MDNDVLKKLILAGGKVPPQVFHIDATKPVEIDQRCSVDLTGSVIAAMPNGEQSYSILKLVGDGITILGGTFIGERDQHKGWSGEWGHGLNVRGKNVMLKNVVVRNCWGDGFYLSNCENVVIEGCESVGNRRQGLSIIKARNVRIMNSIFADTKGTAPSDGIDIEPDKDDVIDNVTITRCTFRNNAGAHIGISNKRGTVKKVSIRDNLYDGKAIPIKNKLNRATPPLITKLFALWGDYSKYPKTLEVA